jgi:hypothetical protein
MNDMIEFENIVQLHPLRKRTWAVFADESYQDKVILQELEAWAVVEHIYEYRRDVDQPALMLGKLPMCRETSIRPLYLHDMNPYETNGSDFICYTSNPRADWRKAAEKHLAQQAERQRESEERSRIREEQREKHFVVYGLPRGTLGMKFRTRHTSLSITARKM